MYSTTNNNNNSKKKKKKKITYKIDFMRLSTLHGVETAISLEGSPSLDPFISLFSHISRQKPNSLTA